MEFVISDAQVRREKRKQMTMVLMFAVFLAVLAAKAINAEKMTKMRDKPRTSSAGKDSAGCASSPGQPMSPAICQHAGYW